MDQKGVEQPIQGLDMKDLGPWYTWSNRFAILDARYCIMMHKRTQKHGVHVVTPHEPSNYSSKDCSRSDDTYNENSVIDIGNQFLLKEKNAQITPELEEGLTEDSTTTYGASIPSNNTHISSERLSTSPQPDPRLNDDHSARSNKPRAKRSRYGYVGVALDPESSVIGASYTLSILQNYRDNGVSRGRGWTQPEPCGRTNKMAKLSAVARGMCRKPGEVLSLCLEFQKNTLTAITQSQLGENERDLSPCEGQCSEVRIACPFLRESGLIGLLTVRVVSYKK